MRWRSTFPTFLALLSVLPSLSRLQAEPAEEGIYNPLHQYFSQPPTDRFTRLRADLAAGRVTLDTTAGELAFLQSLLQALEVPVSSQMLVFSVTSLQKGLISPRRPRALYFNDDTYVGFVPDGRIEVISTDPQLGNIFYIFDRPARGGMMTATGVRRSEDCMSCHAPHHLGGIPALSIESVVPGLTGGGERAFRREQSGHGVPLEQRFGGWHLTGAGPGFPRNWSNLTITRRDGQALEVPNPPGTYFDLRHYPLPTSDVLPQLLHEHQIGFVNRALQAAYGAREALALTQTTPAEKSARMTELARPLVRYLLFADEVPLVPGSVPGEAAFKEAFAQKRKPASDGAALRDLELSTRLQRYRCSYMIYSPAFAGLPGPLKAEVMKQIEAALQTPGAEFAYLPTEERGEIQRILRDTLPTAVAGS